MVDFGRTVTKIDIPLLYIFLALVRASSTHCSSAEFCVHFRLFPNFLLEGNWHSQAMSWYGGTPEAPKLS